MLEIERKFLIGGFPEDILSKEEWNTLYLELLADVEISQGHLSIEPEVRLHTAKDTRTGETEYRISLKSSGDLSRTELITDVSKEFYEEAKKMLPGKMIEKRYRKYQYGDLILEVCHVDEGLESEFYYSEIEFDSEEAANAFEAPKWLGEEVTYDENYKMKNFWKRTRL